MDSSTSKAVWINQRLPLLSYCGTRPAPQGGTRGRVQPAQWSQERLGKARSLEKTLRAEALFGGASGRLHTPPLVALWSWAQQHCCTGLAPERRKSGLRHRQAGGGTTPGSSLRQPPPHQTLTACQTLRCVPSEYHFNFDIPATLGWMTYYSPSYG